MPIIHDPTRTRVLFKPDLVPAKSTMNTSTSQQPSRPSNGSNESPSRVKWIRNRKQVQSSARPRLATETFETPSTASTMPSLATEPTKPSSHRKPLVQNARKDSGYDPEPNIGRPDIALAQQRSFSLSSRLPHGRNKNLHIASSVTEDMEAAQPLLAKPRTVNAAVEAPSVPMLATSVSSQPSLSTSGNLRSRSASRIKTDTSATDRGASSSSKRRLTSLLSNPQRRVLAGAPETPAGPTDTSASSYDGRRYDDIERIKAKRMTEVLKILDWYRRPPFNIPHRPASPEALLPDPLSSKAPSGILQQAVTTPSAPTVTRTMIPELGGIQRHSVHERSETPPWLSCPTPLDSHTASQVVPGPTSKEPTAVPRNTEAQKPCEAHDPDSPIILHPKPIPHTSRSAAADLDGKAAEGDGINDNIRDSSKKAVAWASPGKEHTVKGLDKEVRKLRSEHDGLRQEVEALRSEFRALKDVLLAKDGEGR